MSRTDFIRVVVMTGDRLRVRVGMVASAVVIALVWVTGCGEGSGPDIVPSDTGFVSNPVRVAATAGLSAGLRSGTLDAADQELVFVALAPGTVPDGQFATVRRLGATNTVTASITVGGLDPVPVVASPGDQIEIVVAGSGSGGPATFTMTVPLRRRPVVVRADPPPRKRDVPLNSGLVFVFNEPVDGASLINGVQLFRGNKAIPGTVELLFGTATAAVFRPSVALDPNADYRLVASNAVRDLTGDPLAASVEVDFTTGQTVEGTPNSIAVVPDTSAILIGSQVQVLGSARDSAGNVVHGVPFIWSSDNATVASVSDAGLVTALAAGVAHISGGGSITGAGVATVFVVASQAPVNSLAITPDSSEIPLGPGGGTERLSALLRDSAGNVLPFRQVQWSTSDPAIATVAGGSGGKALVRGVATGTVEITASSEGKSDTVTLHVVSPGPFARVLAGGPDFYNHGHTCGVTVDDWVLCWGVNQWGQAGTGIGGFSTAPVGLGGIHLSVVAPSLTRSCGLTPAGSAYCWGSNILGALGIGTTFGPESCFGGTACSETPVAVVGGLTFTDIGVGNDHVCGLTAGGVYCWGYNGYGQLGNGTNQAPDCVQPLGFAHICSSVPILVIGGHAFTALSVGSDHACALTATGAAYCWGANGSGQLGDSTNQDRFAPVLVAGGHTFIALAAAGASTCGLIQDSTAYCWGANDGGLLGIGTTAGPELCPGGSPCSLSPARVATTLKFRSLSRGHGLHRCAIATDNEAYCWGDNEWGQLGNGSTSNATVPVAVGGGLQFANISVALFHSCGVTLGGIAYCWGDNAGGQLGTGTMTGSTVPGRVVGQP